MKITDAKGKAIDELMERASSALVTTNYFEAEKLALKAMARAFAEFDYERMARICMPLQEARRQKRHEATDAAATFIISTLPVRSEPQHPGCYLLQPPLIGLEAQQIRDLADRRRTPVLVLCKEPTTSAGRWPIVGVSDGDREALVVRVQVLPPDGFEHMAPRAPNEGLRPGPSPRWFLATQEALGDAAIAKVNPNVPPDHRAQDLYELLRAVPDHEKLHQELESACRKAAVAPRSERPRRRAVIDDPYGF